MDIVLNDVLTAPGGDFLRLNLNNGSNVNILLSDIVFENELRVETIRREAAEATLQTNIDTETARITQEISDRQGAVADNTGLINTEVTARGVADTTLQTNITTEKLARETADTTLQDNIDVEKLRITNEITAREGADTTLTTAIDTEKTRAEAAEDKLTTDLAGEANIRALSVTGLTNRFDPSFIGASFNNISRNLTFTDHLSNTVVVNIPETILDLSKFFKGARFGTSINVIASGLEQFTTPGLDGTGTYDIFVVDNPILVILVLL